MSQIDMRKLREESDKRELKKIEMYDDILKKCHHRILYNSRLQRPYCFFQIPEFVFGVPLYNVSELRKYMMNSLNTNGFQLLYIEPNWLFIYWNVKSKGLTKHTDVNIIKKQQNYKSTDTYKPSGNFIYDNPTLMNMADKFN
tara:strand:- start:320 stop:745 length:426 start_codon:yes stop_codon:yes gene_type:complete